MKIRNAVTEDIPVIMQIYSSARAFMRSTGNPSQWAGAYPAKEDIEHDIKLSCLYVCTDNEEILGVFYYFEGIDPTYVQIYKGSWLNDKPYGVIHRIAVGENAHGKGIAAFCFDYCYKKCGNIKIDTHKDNIPMQKALSKNGFKECGIIYLANGDERIAFQKI